MSRLHLLGQVAFERDGTASALRLPPKALVLLVLVACSGERALLRESLAQRLWPDDEPAAARANLRRHLHLLSRAIGDDALAVTPRSVRWNSSSALGCDAREFDALQVCEPERAVALYAGDLAFGVNDDLLEDLRRSYAERFSSALRSLCVQARGAGDDERLLLLLQRSVAHDRFNEAAVRELMNVRARLGDRTGAIREYTALSARLKAELDAGPETETTRVYDALLLATEQSPTPTNLPHVATSFVGRDLELQSLMFGVRAKRLITIAGPAGIGKTRLAVQLGWTQLKHFTGGVWFVDAVGARDRADLFERLGIASGANFSRDTAEQRICEHMQASHALVIFDNCEHLAAAVSGVAATLSTQTPLHVLITSRRRLGVDGENVVSLAPLPVPDAGASPDGLMRSDAARLFIDRAARAAPHLRVQHENAHTLAEIVRGLDGVPLAIELVASRANLLTLEGIAKRLRDTLTRAHNRSAQPRHRSIEDAVAWSYDMLSERERIVFDVSAIFEGSWTLESLEAVLPDGFGDGFDELSELLESSLVHVQAAQPAYRYGMLETTREFARRKLAERGTLSQVAQAHARHFTGMLERIFPASEGTREQDYYVPIDADYPNIRAALEFSLGADVEVAARLCAALYRYWTVRGRLPEGWRLLRIVRDSTEFPTLPLQLRGRFFLAGGVIARELGEAGGARELLDAALECFATLRDRRGEWDALWACAKLDLNCGNLLRSREIYRRCLVLQDEIGDEFARASAIANIGCLSHTLGEFDDAKAQYEMALAEYSRLGHTRGLAYIWRQLALIAREPHEAEEAVAFARRSIAMAKEIGEPVREADALVILAGTLNDLGRHDEALSAGVEALEILERTAHAQFTMLASERLAETAAYLGRPLEAVRFHGFAHGIREGKSLKVWEGYQRDIDAAVAELRRSLPPERFLAAWHAGEAMSASDLLRTAHSLRGSTDLTAGI